MMAVNFLTEIPSWEASDLTSLGQNNQLSGVPPEYLAIIDKEESSGTGGAINSIGDGGFFGLQQSATYVNPAGQSFVTTPTLLKATTPAAFDQQAETAAASFATDLQATGNPLSAEARYQTGSGSASSPGQALFEEAGITGNLTQSQLEQLLTDSASTATATATGTNPSSAGPTLTGPGAVFQDINNLLNPQGSLTNTLSLGTLDLVKLIAFRGIFAISFIGITYLGFKALTSPGSSSSVINLVNTTTNAQTGRKNAAIAQGRLDLDTRKHEAATKAAVYATAEDALVAV